MQTESIIRMLINNAERRFEESVIFYPSRLKEIVKNTAYDFCSKCGNVWMTVTVQKVYGASFDAAWDAFMNIDINRGVALENYINKFVEVRLLAENMKKCLGRFDPDMFDPSTSSVEEKTIAELQTELGRRPCPDEITSYIEDYTEDDVRYDLRILLWLEQLKQFATL